MMRAPFGPCAAAALAAALAVWPASAEPRPDARAEYKNLIETESAREGLPPQIAEAVMSVESGYNPAARGAAGEVGLMQVMPGTARMLGFSGADHELAAPEVNIRLGVRYLAGAWRRGGQDICTAAMKYRAGHGESRFSTLSVSYCVAVRGKLAALGYPVTGTVPAADFASAGAAAPSARPGGRRFKLAGGCAGVCLKGFEGRADLTALNVRFSTMVSSAKQIRLPLR